MEIEKNVARTLCSYIQLSMLLFIYSVAASPIGLIWRAPRKSTILLSLLLLLKASFAYALCDSTPGIPLVVSCGESNCELGFAIESKSELGDCRYGLSGFWDSSSGDFNFIIQKFEEAHRFGKSAIYEGTLDYECNVFVGEGANDKINASQKRLDECLSQTKFKKIEGSSIPEMKKKWELKIWFSKNRDRISLLLFILVAELVFQFWKRRVAINQKLFIAMLLIFGSAVWYLWLKMFEESSLRFWFYFPLVPLIYGIRILLAKLLSSVEDS